MTRKAIKTCRNHHQPELSARTREQWEIVIAGIRNRAVRGKVQSIVCFVYGDSWPCEGYSRAASFCRDYDAVARLRMQAVVYALFAVGFNLAAADYYSIEPVDCIQGKRGAYKIRHKRQTVKAHGECSVYGQARRVMVDAYRVRLPHGVQV